MRVDATEVQITLASGKVLDFKTALNDKITVQHINTYAGDMPKPGNEIEYYVIQVAPSQGPTE